jgi:2'-5' RNA ligase
VRAAETLLRVDRVVLYRSHLGRGPARYEALAAASLGGGPS